MLKKIILGVLFAGFIGLLVWGGINRTRDQATKTAEAAGYGGTGNARSQEKYTANGNRGPGNAGARESQSAVSQAQVDTWIELDAVVASVEETALTVTLADGQVALIEGRPWRFALEQEIKIEVGDRLRLTGFYEDTAFEVGQIENLDGNQVVSIRNESGRPLWAGGGNGR